MIEVRFMLPLPPPLSALTFTDWRTKQRPASRRYKDWKLLAFVALHNQFRGPPPKVLGKVSVTYMLGREDQRRQDAFNREKGLSDFLKDQRLIEDDSLIELGTIGWTSEHPGQVEVTIRAWSAS